MSVGFRKSLFGFNSDDVMEYISKTHNEFVQKETVLNEKIENLNTELDDAKAQISSIIDEKEQLEAKLKEYTDKYEEIERLSQNIGKLYLVAENNANSVMESAKQSKQISAEEISKNIAVADSTFASLSELKEEITKTSAEFSAKLQELMLSLEATKNNIRLSNLSSEKKIEEYEELLQNINA